jgi:HEAT repeat protein
MSESRYRPEDPPANGWPHRASSGEELLPPVEPPPAGFILKLFVIPALIVLVLLGVWQIPKWLVRQTSAQPDDLIKSLESGPSIARFQTAFDLANKLRDKRYAEFKRSPQAAQSLARILKREIEGAGAGADMEQGEVTLRYYLCHALGEFAVPDGIAVLIQAAQTARDPSEQVVRYGAIEAIALRAYNLAQLEPPQTLAHPDLEPALFRLAVDEDPVIRSTTAYALGVLGTPAALARLEAMVDDPHADTRYNSATALAHHGSAAGVETLAEMLALEELASVEEESNDQSRAFKRAVIVSNAINATQELARQNPQADLSPVIQALEQLTSANADALAAARIPTRVVSDVRETLAQLEKGN